MNDGLDRCLFHWCNYLMMLTRLVLCLTVGVVYSSWLSTQQAYTPHQQPTVKRHLTAWQSLILV
jgi:hypothetical protein